MRKKVLSLALSAGLMAATVSTAFAQAGGGGPDMGIGEGGRPMTRAEMISGIHGFCLETARNWSIEGYSDVASMRAAEGSSQSDWLTKTQKALGIRTDISTAALCTQVAGMAAPAGGTAQTGQTGQQTGQTGQQTGTTPPGQTGGTRETGGQQGETGPGGSGGPGSGGPGR